MDEDATPPPPWPEARDRERRAQACLTLLLLGCATAPLGVGWARLAADPSHTPRRPLPVAVDLARDPAWRLQLIPGVGVRRAQAILADRRRHGAPQTVEDLARIPGLTPDTVTRLRTTEAVRVRLSGQPVRCADEQDRARRGSGGGT